MASYYQILDIPKNASLETIKNAYRKLSLKYHPDKSGGNSSQFISIQEAYETLKDTDKRAIYDAQFSTHNETISTSFNTTETAPPPIILHCNITLEQAYIGNSIPVTVKRWIDVLHNIETELIYVKIPKGADTGEFIIIKDKGNICGSLIGIIKLIINVINNTQFLREGLDLTFIKEVTLKEALCGCKFAVLHLDRNKKLSYSSLDNGQVLSDSFKIFISNYGMVREDGTVGNLTISFRVVFPNKLDCAVREKLAEIL